MTTSPTLKDLATRMQKLTGPCRQTDAEIHRLVFPDDTGAPPRYTADVVAALILFQQNGDALARSVTAASLLDRPYRLSNYVGRVRTRLAKAITQAFSDAGITVICEPHKLRPALGYWKDHRRDVMRWKGSILIWRHGKFSSVSICSWEPMTGCLKGFCVRQNGFSYEVGAIEENVALSKRYVCEFEADQYHANAPEPQP